MDLATPPIPTRKSKTVVLIVTLAILALAIFTRFYILGERPMSHDEVNHVVPSYDLYQGRGYRHDPVTHGPMQFHLVALSYFLFGDSDFTSRIPSALFSIATVAFVMWGYRRYFGTIGALAAGLLYTLSPYMLFYGRYVRNESFVALFGVVMLFAILRYRETGQGRYLLLLTAVVSLHFATKETSYIYIAQAMIFLALLFLERVLRARWINGQYFRPFLILALVAVLLAGGALATLMAAPTASQNAPSAAARPEGTAATPGAESAAAISPLAIGLAVLAVAALGGALYLLVRGMTFAALRKERSFDLLVLLIALTLPLLSPFPDKLLGWDPLDYTTAGIVRTAVVVLLLFAVSGAIGFLWRWRTWLINMLLFYSIFLVLYTTTFTNIRGIGTGLVGSLGYWLVQQGVNRGEQPLYYYALVQLPMYEYLPLIGTILAAILGIRMLLRRGLWRPVEAVSADVPVLLSQQNASEPELAAAQDVPLAPVAVFESPDTLTGEVDAIEDEKGSRFTFREPEHDHSLQPVSPLWLLVFWAVSSLAAFSVAGEKMPWLTVHITLPMLLATGWLTGYLAETTTWRELFARGRARPWIALALLPVFLVSAYKVVTIIGSQRALLLAGNDPDSLAVTVTFFTALVALIGSVAGLLWLLRDWSTPVLLRSTALLALAFLAVITARASFRANYVNFENGKEYLQYAHTPTAPKQAFEQILEISRRVTGGLDLKVAYDNDTRYPYWWYMRDFTNKNDFNDQVTRNLRDYPIITIGEGNAAKIEQVVAGNYERFDMLRMVWPNQDYYKYKWANIETDYLSDLQKAGLPRAEMTTSEYLRRVWAKLKGDYGDPAMRHALWLIWWNRDYSEYARLLNRDTFSEGNWDPNNRMRLYIRKDIVAMLYPHGVQPSTLPVAEDPYKAKSINLTAVQAVGTAGSEPGQFQSPRQVAFAPDGSLYVADSRNHRIQHLAADGSLLGMFGSFADVSKGDAPGGTFYEPWGVAVGKDGSVFVADTWNNRIQKFTADGQFIRMWGYFGQAEAPEAFWGPRALAVNADGRLLVMDTGNKRVVVFDADGNYITQFGSAGFDAGQFDEPTGLALDAAGNVYITDTWNQRVQVMMPADGGQSYLPVTQWDVSAWTGESLENKPFIAVDAANRVFVTDPEGNRVLVFTANGEFLFAWGDYGAGLDAFNIASSVSVDASGAVWVSDAGNGRLLKFDVPVQ